MSLWEFGAAVGGYAKANTPDDDVAITKDEAKSLAEFIDAPPVWH
jgi:hypothetical protein